MTGVIFAVDVCYVHGEPFTFDPVSVVTVPIDPQTGLPPDVDADLQPVPSPDPDAVARSVWRPICDPCVQRANRQLAAQGRDLIVPAALRQERG